MGKEYSQKELIKIAKKQGWEFDSKRGKGSHAYAEKEGERPLTIPKNISKGVLESIKKRLKING